VAIGQNIAEMRYGDFSTFVQDGGRPPSWICDTRVWTTHGWHLVVFLKIDRVFRGDIHSQSFSPLIESNIQHAVPAFRPSLNKPLPQLELVFD